MSDLDARWKLVGDAPIRLQVIGSAALMLQSAYERGTKDGDVLESGSVTPLVKQRLLELAGKGTDFAIRNRAYIDIVNPAILFLPQQATFHPLPHLALRNFSVEALDVTEVVLSKLKRFNRSDAGDIRAMADLKLLDHARLVARFKAAADWFSIDARVCDLPRCLRNLQEVERDILDVPLTAIELPEVP